MPSSPTRDRSARRKEQSCPGLFLALRERETDCWDVPAAADQPDFVLAQASGTPESFAREDIPGAAQLAQEQICAEVLVAWPTPTLFVGYCAGPPCTSADRLAVEIAELGSSVRSRKWLTIRPAG